MMLQATEGVAELVRCVALSRVLFGDGHWRLAQAYTDLAHAYLHLRGEYICTRVEMMNCGPCIQWPAKVFTPSKVFML